MQISDEQPEQESPHPTIQLKKVTQESRKNEDSSEQRDVIELDDQLSIHQ